jgi:hypothetical protein
VTPFDLGVYKRATKADVGRRESLKLSRWWPRRPTLAAMAALHGWAMAEFQR